MPRSVASSPRGCFFSSATRDLYLLESQTLPSPPLLPPPNSFFPPGKRGQESFSLWFEGSFLQIHLKDTTQTANIHTYLGAMMVSWRMIDSSNQRTSDFLYGSTFCYIVSRMFAAKHKLPEITGFQIKAMMAIDPCPSAGIALVK
jgi:hypothetical protein